MKIVMTKEEFEKIKTEIIKNEKMLEKYNAFFDKKNKGKFYDVFDDSMIVLSLDFADKYIDVIFKLILKFIDNGNISKAEIAKWVLLKKKSIQ